VEDDEDDGEERNVVAAELRWDHGDEKAEDFIRWIEDNGDLHVASQPPETETDSARRDENPGKKCLENTLSKFFVAVVKSILCQVSKLYIKESW
jgi:hypothetical protein